MGFPQVTAVTLTRRERTLASRSSPGEYDEITGSTYLADIIDYMNVAHEGAGG